MESLEATALVVSDTEDGEIVMRVVLLLEVLEFLVELLAGVRIDLNWALSLSISSSDLTNSDSALLVMDGLLLDLLEVGLDVESPKAVDKYHQSNERDCDGHSNDCSVVCLHLLSGLSDHSRSNLLRRSGGLV